MFCTQCGKPFADPNAKFCTECGAATRRAAPAPQEASGAESLPTSEAAQPMGWDDFFKSLGSEVLRVSQTAPERFEFEGETKVKALLSRTTLRFQAVALLDAAAHRIQWWEKLSESSFGIAPADFGVSAQTHTQRGTAVNIAKTVRTPGGGYTYRYGDLRAVLENEARQRGWELAVVTRRP